MDLPLGVTNPGSAPGCNKSWICPWVQHIPQLHWVLQFWICPWLPIFFPFQWQNRQIVCFSMKKMFVQFLLFFVPRCWYGWALSQWVNKIQGKMGFGQIWGMVLREFSFLRICSWFWLHREDVLGQWGWRCHLWLPVRGWRTGSPRVWGQDTSMADKYGTCCNKSDFFYRLFLSMCPDHFCSSIKVCNR